MGRSSGLWIILRPRLPSQFGPWRLQPLSPLTAAGPRGSLTRFPFHPPKGTPMLMKSIATIAERWELPFGKF